MQEDLFWKLNAISDAELLGGLVRVVGAGRRTLAELLAHLCEVEDRRLHLDAGYPSMFAYCTAKLMLSEDEASRRIDVARLARRAPIVFRLIAEGKLSLSAAALLKPHIMSPELAELIGRVSGKSVQAAREALATAFPRPDVASSVRKLPARVAQSENPSNADGAQLLLHTPGSTRAPRLAPDAAAVTPATPPARCQSLETPRAGATTQHEPAPQRARTIEPLSQGRYKVQFTADAILKQQLELARDLLRHTIPNGDLGAIVQRAVKLLVDDLMKRRFGAGAPKTPADGAPPRRQQPRRDPTPPNITRSTRRAVAERDGLRCTWCGPDGTRCSARAWLELDHQVCRGLGGGSSVTNLRLLCRAHNLRAAEHVYGERHIARAIYNRRTRSARSSPDAHPVPPE